MLVEHLKSQRLIGEVSTFYILNVFKFGFKPINLNHILEAGLLHEKYLHLYQGALINSNSRIAETSKFVVIKDYEYYGSLKRVNIGEKDFEKSNYYEYLTYMESMFQEWEKIGEDDLYLRTLRDFHERSIDDLNLFNFTNTTFHTLSAPFSNYTGNFQLNWIYGRFITTIGTNPDSQRVFVINLGDD